MLTNAFSKLILRMLHRTRSVSIKNVAHIWRASTVDNLQGILISMLLLISDQSCRVFKWGYAFYPGTTVSGLSSLFRVLDWNLSENFSPPFPPPSPMTSQRVWKSAVSSLIGVRGDWSPGRHQFCVIFNLDPKCLICMRLSSYGTTNTDLGI